MQTKTLPKVGEYYHFFDDGKTSVGRHYIARVERLIPKDEAKGMMFSFLKDEDMPQYDFLYDHYKEQVEHCPWLYANDTDYFVECSIPKYCEDSVYFVRTKDGGWFSIDVTECWQSGRLDVTGGIYNTLIEFLSEDPSNKTLMERAEKHKNITY